MTPAFDKLQGELKQLPGLGFRSAERIAIHLLLEKRDKLERLAQALVQAGAQIRPCERCGHISEDGLCAICADAGRAQDILCVVEGVPDLMAMEKSGAYRGRYLVLGGKLSPIHGVGPEHLRMEALGTQLASGQVEELILALGNDIESEATCHYIQEELVAGRPLKVTRIGFGLPSGGGLVFADAVTLRSALEGRRAYH